jgi:ActR/RegA family two-component response regulator
MQSQKRTIILLLRDDAVTRQVLRALGGMYVVSRVGNLSGAIALIRTDPHIAAIITEQGAANGDAIESLETVRAVQPQVRRIMLTSYADLTSIVHGLHSGAVQSLVQKPVSEDELLAALCSGMPQAAEAGRHLAG